MPGFGVLAWDNCTPCDQLIKTQTPRPGTPVEPGTHVITIQVRDAAGNTTTCRTQLIVSPPKQAGKPDRHGKHGKHGRADGDD